MDQNIPQLILANGFSLPAIGLGTYKSTDQEATQNTIEALQCGYRLIDTAMLYQNETEVGEAIRISGVSRAEIRVTTKLWRTDLGYENVKPAFDRSLQLLGLEYIDLYLIHWPAHAGISDKWNEINEGTWRAMEEIYESGQVKAIGVSNFLIHHLEDLLKSCRIKPMINQIEFHPGYMQSDTLSWCKSADIIVEGWSPLGRGEIFNNPLIIRLAHKYNKTVAQIALRWATQHQVIPIPKASGKMRLKENISIFDFHLTDEEIQDINHLPEMAFSGYHPDRWK